MDTLYNITPRNFLNAQIGTRRLYQVKEQGEWERARWMACVIINPHLKKSVDPKKITTFPWEKPAIKLTKNQIKHNIEKIIQESEYDDKESQYVDKIEKLNKEKNA